MGIAAVLDKAGPALASGIILAVLAAATSAALAWRDLQSTSGVRWSWVTEQISDLRGECGKRESQLADLERRIREQETRPPRLGSGLEAAIEHVHDNRRTLSVLEERVKSLENRIVGVGPNGWHRQDHEGYARMIEAQLSELETRLRFIEKGRK